MLRLFTLFFTYSTLLFSTNFGLIFDEYPFVGTSVSTQTLSTKEGNSHQQTTLALTYGSQTIEMRTSFTLEFAKNYSTLNMEIDRIIDLRLFGTPRVRPYIGAIAGVLDYDDETPTDHKYGYYYGGVGGLLFYVNETIDADLSYHYSKIKGYKSLNKMKGLSASLHYFY